MERETYLWDQFLSVHFCQKHGKNSVPSEKNFFFFKSTKTHFTVYKISKFCTYFNTVKPVFVDLKKTIFFSRWGTIFPTFLKGKKNVPKKIGPKSLTLFSKFGKNETKLPFIKMFA